MKLTTLPPRVQMLQCSRITPMDHEQVRGNSTKRGYGYKWQQAREGFIRKHPLCVQCERLGLFVPTEEVDHIVPHRGDKVLFWDRTNWQPLCKPCHSSKTASGQ